MASDSNTESSDRQRLPFEPSRSRKKAKVQPSEQPVPVRSETKSRESREEQAATDPLQERARRILGKSSQRKEPEPVVSQESGIPEVVSRRMVSRMVVLCGIPSTMGILVFVISYQLVSHDWVILPNVAVLLASMGCFGLGVVGLSYGALSASWEEDTPGSLLGISEFAVNVKRMTDAWAEAREKRANKG
jgi:predicted RND superfamily exporter protein